MEGLEHGGGRVKVSQVEDKLISSSDYAFRARRVFHPRNWVIGKVWCCRGKTEAGGEVGRRRPRSVGVNLGAKA